mgnify:CR=1 FL=1
MLTFCTLFDSNYIDKGIVLQRSMESVIPNYKLYILAMDDRCYEILSDMKLNHTIVISLTDFEDEELGRIRKERTRAEYCWTCSANLIDYIFETYQEEYCTYIDSDLYFYKNPMVLLEEMCLYQCSAQIVEHGFGSGSRARRQLKNSGRFCVQFNTFKNDVYGRDILSTWKNQCRAHCSMDTNEMGDQKYLSEWPEKYEKVHVLQHQGGGVAPWNLFRFKKSTKGVNTLVDKKTKKEFELIFYHFHHLEYIDDAHVNINVFKKGIGVDQILAMEIYLPYLKALDCVKKELRERYSFTPMIKSHPGFVKRSKKDKIAAMKCTKGKDFLYRVQEKIIYVQGKKKDILDLSSIV